MHAFRHRVVHLHFVTTKMVLHDAIVYQIILAQRQTVVQNVHRIPSAEKQKRV